MFFQLLLACFLLVDAGKTPDDVSTVTCEDDWWHASRHMDELHSYCSSWHGGVQLHCFDLFSRSGRIARTFAKHGFRSRSYDILSLASQDILSEAGFFEALDTAFQPLSNKKCRRCMMFYGVLFQNFQSPRFWIIFGYFLEYLKFYEIH